MSPMLQRGCDASQPSIHALFKRRVAPLSTLILYIILLKYSLNVNNVNIITIYFNFQIESVLL